jgi:gluconate 2-dehydrogenase gamma chain
VEYEAHRARDAYMFFTEREASTVSAMAERIIPADSTGPGASDADVIIYIDRAIAGYGRNLQRLYRRGVIGINRLAGENSAGKTFFELPIAKQDELLTWLADWLFSPTRAVVGVRPEGWTLLAEFFGAVRLHTIEGMFCDPMYGGNRDCLGWKLIGFPGAQWGYSAEQMRLGFDAATIPPKTLADLRRERLAGEVGQLRA